MRPGFISRLLRDEGGAMAIETAIVAPVLALMSIGAFEVGSMVSRQQELQSAASEAEGIILAASASAIETEASEIEDVIETSLGLDPEDVTLAEMFRCNNGALTATAPTSETCPGGRTFIYVQIEITDSYTPVWANYGFGKTIDYNIERTVMVQ